MTTAAANLYQHRAVSVPLSAASKLEKAQKSSGFRAQSTNKHRIKDRVLIDRICGTGHLFVITCFHYLVVRVEAMGTWTFSRRPYF